MTLISQIEHVAIIGAGISGIVSAKHLKAAGIQVTVYERSGTAGGIWCYDERPSPEPRYPSINPSLAEEYPGIESRPNGALSCMKVLFHAPPGPCYDSLTNNVSTPLLELRDHPWKKGTQDFVNHRIIKEYIQSVADAINMTSFTHFHTKVLRVRKVPKKWHILSGTLKPSAAGGLQYSEQIREYDAVVVASGHYQAPVVPDIPGLNEWKLRWPDRVQHSKSYRRPQGFENQNVLLVGAGVSSMDIAREISPFTNRIYQVFRSSLFELPAAWLPHNTQRVGNIKSFQVVSNDCEGSRVLRKDQPLPEVVILEDGSVIRDIHRVILCTGYHFCFPFLSSLHSDSLSAKDADERCVVTDGTQAHNLHKDMFYIPDPTLVFIRIPFHSATFTLFEFQAMAMAAVYAGRADFPTIEDMRKEYVEKAQQKGYGRPFHSIRDREVEYVDDLLAWANRNCVSNGANPILGHSAYWRAQRAAWRDKLAQWFLSRSGKTAQHRCANAESGSCALPQFYGNLQEPNMAPSAISGEDKNLDTFSPALGLQLPRNAEQRLRKAGIDPRFYPTRPQKPEYLDEVYAIRSEYREYLDPGSRADPEKKTLFKEATVTHLTRHIGTELSGIQLAQLTSQQRDELGLLIAERSVVFLRNQDISPQQQKELGEHFGEIEVHPQVPQVPGVPGVTVMWPDLQIKERGSKASFRQPGGASGWHTDLVHEAQPAGVTHLHNDTVPGFGGDTVWSSGYSAYDKLSPAFKVFVDGKTAIYRSAHAYIDRNDPKAGPKHVEREHPLVRVHPATGWKTLWVNRAMTVRILGLEKAESALWDNRITQHIASWDYEGSEARHGTRVVSLAEKPFFHPNAPTRREALGLDI
ncbi:MAG: hypothetical protein Q9214_004233 [Letrouitia sp. 1 TL-2023]